MSLKLLKEGIVLIEVKKRTCAPTSFRHANLRERFVRLYASGRGEQKLLVEISVPRTPSLRGSQDAHTKLVSITQVSALWRSETVKFRGVVVCPSWVVWVEGRSNTDAEAWLLPFRRLHRPEGKLPNAEALVHHVAVVLDAESSHLSGRHWLWLDPDAAALEFVPMDEPWKVAFSVPREDLAECVAVPTSALEDQGKLLRLSFANRIGIFFCPLVTVRSGHEDP